MSSFKADLAAEQILGAFLSKHYELINYETVRNNKLDLQYKGVDVVYTDKSQLSFKIDEKAQLHYLNKDLPTFALEINYLKDNEIKLGWLFDSSKITEIYAFIFSIHLFSGIEELSAIENIKSCEVVFVNRIRLLNELALLDIDFKFCQKQSEILRKDISKIKIDHPSGFNFQISNQLSEKPVNLVVKKTFLMSIGKHLIFS